MSRIGNLLLFSFIFLSAQAGATGDSLHYLLPRDSVVLEITHEGAKSFYHVMAPKQTLFSLSKFYGVSVEELYYYNDGLKDKSVSVGKKIKVPVPNKAIKRFWDSSFKTTPHAKVYYRIKKGDTMFRISNVFFKMSADTLMKRNGLASEVLKEGQTLWIGWMSTSGVPEGFHTTTVSPPQRRNESLKSIFEKELKNKKPQYNQGAAMAKGNSKAEMEQYALHRYAKINSIIQVTNPMTHRVIYAKVIGRIPDSAYDDNIAVVVSPSVAKSLKGLDERFFVKIKYIQ